MKYVSLFTGVGGFDLGAETAGWKPVAMVERDADCQQVLAHHWPDVPLYGDVRDYDGASHIADAIVGGFPCQDVSTAGKRAGIGEGTRSGLYAEIIRITKEMQDATDGAFPRWVVLENVRGLLSQDGGASFGRVLDDLADLGALVIEWGMCDTQFFGPPQRRQRVFVCACFDPRAARNSPSPLLPLSESGHGHLTPRRTSRKGAASRAEGSTDTGGLTADAGIVTALTAMEGMTRPDLAHAQAGWLVPTGFNWQNGGGYANANDGLGITPNGTGPLTTSQVPAVAYSVFENQRNEVVEKEQTNALNTGGGKPGSGRAVVRQGMTVRRITPLEAERLQGWPDHHTLHRADGKQQADTKRYHQIGNGISAPVAAWVCSRISLADPPPTSHTKAIVQFSGGAGSFGAALRAIERFGKDNVTLLFADTLIEDEDLYRFLEDSEAALGIKITRIADGRTPWEVFKDVRFLGNARIDPCSRVLKRDLLRAWIEEHATPDESVIVLGIDWTESHRLDRAAPRWTPWTLWAPLCEEPYLDKADFLAAAGVDPPRLYAMGFPHNNCGGFCVKAGQAQFALLHKVMPERYAQHEAEEEALRTYLEANVSVMRDRRNKTSIPMTMKTFREERLEPKAAFDKDEWGGCGCAID